jgi:hypothetical protein
MATIQCYGGSPANAVLCTSQTGTGPSTNVVDRGGTLNPALLVIVSTVGATPTVTVDIQGSVDLVNWFNVSYGTAAAPETPVVTALTISTATTGFYIMRPNQPWRYLRLNLSSNTNVTLSAVLWTT